MGSDCKGVHSMQELVERALALNLPSSMRSRSRAKPLDAAAAAARIGVTGQLGSNGIVRRSAKALVMGRCPTPFGTISFTSSQHAK